MNSYCECSQTITYRKKYYYSCCFVEEENKVEAKFFKSERDHFCNPNWSALETNMKKNTSAMENAGGIKAWSFRRHQLLVRRVMQLTMFIAGLPVLWVFLSNSASSIEFHTFSHYFTAQSTKVSFSLSQYIYIYIYIIPLGIWRVIYLF